MTALRGLRCGPAGALFLAAALVTPPLPAWAEPGFRPIALTATAIEAFDRGSAEVRFGELTFRGGLVLRSAERDFGSLSGVDIAADGTLLAVADTGTWFAARLEETAAGVPTGLADARLAPILDLDGAEDTRKTRSDAESIRFAVEDGRRVALVSFERMHQVRRFPADDFLAAAFALATPERVALPEMAQLRGNRGLEAIAAAPADGLLHGALVLVSERALDGRGNILGWVVSGPGPGGFAVVRRDGYDITDAAFLGDDLFVLERRFSLFGGSMRIRRLWAGAIRPGATVDGPTVIEAGLSHEVDNMEGIAVRRTPAGALVTLVSDDNASPLQRTLLLQFVWIETLPPLPRPKPAAPPA